MKKVAIVHDWLVTYAGAERVLEQILLIYPDADVFSIVDFLEDDQRGFLLGKKAETSFIQKLPFAKKKYRSYLPLMPLAVEQFNLSEYSLIISSSHAVAKGVITGPDQRHICMCYSPIRYAWDLQFQYLSESGLDRGVKGWIAKWILHKLRIWDIRSSMGVDRFIAISDYISRRIEKVYRRDSFVIYPPVDVDAFNLEPDKGDYYLTASRMVPYKKIDLIVKAFTRMPDCRLKVIGAGPDFDKIQNAAKDFKNIEILGYRDFEYLKTSMQKAKAFIFAAEEDFGIIPIEAQACGTPVIAFGKGGAIETINGINFEDEQDEVLEDKTGVFFSEQSEEKISDAVTYFEKHIDAFSPSNCRKNALKFSTSVFISEFNKFMCDNV